MIDYFISKLLKFEILSEDEIADLCRYAIEIFSKEQNVITVNAPITICGDLHGQFYDLLELFNIGGLPPDTNYLFMGDYVDRGFHSIETLSLLLCFKVKYPTRIWLLRGNHESRQITQVYGFFDECIRKYASSAVWRLFTDLFDYLPISAVINNDTFCCHGGLSPSFDSIDQLKEIDRKIEVPHEGAMCDLLWSDPEEKGGWGPSPRGAGFTFGPDITETFNKKNNLKMICRAHQLVMQGHTWNHNQGCVTIFSAPNYCYRCGNLATFVEMDELGSMSFTQFDKSPVKIDDVDSFKLPGYFM